MDGCNTFWWIVKLHQSNEDEVSRKHNPFMTFLLCLSRPPVHFQHPSLKNQGDTRKFFKGHPAAIIGWGEVWDGGWPEFFTIARGPKSDILRKACHKFGFVSNFWLKCISKCKGWVKNERQIIYFSLCCLKSFICEWMWMLLFSICNGICICVCVYLYIY